MSDSPVKCIGIDFGTTNTVVFCNDSNGKVINLFKEGIKTAVFFHSREEITIGQQALDFGLSDIRALATNFKPEIKEKVEYIAQNGDIIRTTNARIAEMFLDKLRSEYLEKKLKKYFGSAELCNDDRVVITVPAKFDEDEKLRVRTAASNAFFVSARAAFEPTAAAIAAAEGNNLLEERVIAVYDFGGGTFDISVIEKDRNELFIPIERDGMRKGGNDITDAVLEQCVFKCLEKQGLFLSTEDIEDLDFEDNKAEDEFRRNVQICRNYVDNNVKYAFTEDNDEYAQPLFLYCNGERRQFDIKITRQEFDKAIRDIILETLNITARTIGRVKKKGYTVTSLVLAGGSSQLRLVSKMLKDEFEAEGISICTPMNYDIFQLISRGALTIAQSERRIRVEEKTDAQFGIGTGTGIGRCLFEMLIDADVPLPVSSKTKTYPIPEEKRRVGEITIPCFRKDVKNYPDAKTNMDEGINLINVYKLPFDPKSNPVSIDVIITIEADGTPSINAVLYDNDGKAVMQFNDEMQFDCEV